MLIMILLVWSLLFLKRVIFICDKKLSDIREVGLFDGVKLRLFCLILNNKFELIINSFVVKGFDFIIILCSLGISFFLFWYLVYCFGLIIGLIRVFNFLSMK